MAPGRDLKFAISSARSRVRVKIRAEWDLFLRLLGFTDRAAEQRLDFLLREAVEFREKLIPLVLAEHELFRNSQRGMESVVGLLLRSSAEDFAGLVEALVVTVETKAKVEHKLLVSIIVNCHSKDHRTWAALMLQLEDMLRKHRIDQIRYENLLGEVKEAILSALGPQAFPGRCSPG